MKLISQYIAPWALPKEDIPIHLVWDPSFPYDSIIVSIPPDIRLKEFLNVDSYSQEGTRYIIGKLKTPNFFGLTIASRDIIEEKHISRKITVVFVLDNEEVYSKNFVANIFRPYVSFVESPNSVTITERTIREGLPEITLKLSGFGAIEIRNEISTGGDFVARAEPLFRGIVRRMVSTFKLEEIESDDKGIKIDPTYLQAQAKEYIEKIENGVFPLDIDKEDLEDFRDWVTDESNRENVMELLSRQIERLLVDSLLFYFEQHPAEDIEMPQGKPVMVIASATRRVTVRFRYRDSMLNEYEPIEVAVNISDKREDRTDPIRVPIKLKWIFETINPLEACD